MTQRITILGGGVGAVTAALALTRTPEQRRTVSVTLYQQGFRLGGKGASGRNLAAGNRIEEHGLHMWLGFYAHGFRLMREVYAELGRDIAEAFEPQPRVLLPEPSGAGWDLSLPLLPGLPWDPAPDAGPRVLFRYLCQGLAALVPELRGEGRGGALRGPVRQRLAAIFDLGRAAVRGMLREVLPGGFGAIDDRDLKTWLVQHGAAPAHVEGQPLRALYSMGFAFPAGRRPGDAAAGVGLAVLLRMLFLNRGALAWRMRGGMGDVIFAPIYEVLRARGVDVRFFHEVEELLPDDTGIGAVRLNRQVALRAPYAPLVRVGGQACWPAEPLPQALETVPRAADLERRGGVKGAPVLLRRGEDFDTIVLGISVGGLAPLTPRLAERSPRWKAMLDNAHTVTTQAVQLWLDRPAEAAGFPADTLVSGAPLPFDSAADMSFLLPLEGRAGHAGLVYGCGADQDPPRPAPPPWPLRPAGVIDSYTRINCDGSERYVLSPAGSIRHRLHPRDSGFDNLRLAGDWTWTPLSCGCVEAAVTSGLLAAGEAV